MTELKTQFEETAAAQTLKLITYGRITSLPHIVELRFAQIADSYLVLAGRANSDWVKNIRRSESGRMRMGDLVYEVSVEEAFESERAHALSIFRSKYGASIVRDWYSKAELCLKLKPKGPPSYRGRVRGENEAKLRYEEWSSRKTDYYQDVVDAFNSASEEYDFTIRNNFINTWIRRESIRELLTIARQSDTLVEVGCGTGAEAIQIADHVSRIIATDISDSMLEILRRKAEAKQLSSKIQPLRLRASDISEVSNYTDDRKVQVVYSFNGALNCEPHLDRFAVGLSGVLERNGHFVCSIRNTLCLSEALSHTLVLQFGKMAPRKKQPIMVSVGGMDIPSIYYSPSSFRKFFAGAFRLKKQLALPGLLPPAYLNDYYLKLRRIFSPLERAEHLLAGRSPLKWFGDQTLFVFQKR